MNVSKIDLGNIFLMTRGKFFVITPKELKKVRDEILYGEMRMSTSQRVQVDTVCIYIYINKQI